MKQANKLRKHTFVFCFGKIEESYDQCDQIGRFIGLWATF